MMVSLARALSKLGLMSRSEAVQRILAGDVRVEGRVVRDPGHRVVPERARISVDGTAVERQTAVTILMNKPRGVVTTRRDPQGRPTVFDLLAGDSSLPYLAPVGRLDMASSGLLLLTNDTRLSDWLLDPANAIPRSYIVTVRGELSDDSVKTALEGVRDRGELLQARAITVLKRSRRETHVRVTLTEGKNRELRRLFRACDHEVTRLTRVGFGGLELGTVPSGRWRVVTAAELSAAFPDAPSRTVRAAVRGRLASDAGAARARRVRTS